MQTDTTRENPQATAPQVGESVQDLSATAPGQLRVIKRNGTVVPYTDDKITVAITKAFLAVEGGTAAASSRIHDTVARLTEQVTATFKRRMPSGGTIHIEEIQDQVELSLMRAGEQKVARDYVIYRDARSKERAVRSHDAPVQAHPSIRITRADGSLVPLDLGRLNTIVTEACEGLAEVDANLIQSETLKNLYDGVALTDVNTALVMTARTLVEREPNYSFVTARLLMDTLRAEGLGFLEVAESATHHEMVDLYAKALPAYIAKGIEFELLNPVLATFDLEKLGKAINHERDQQFTYLGLQTLYDRYFIHKDGIRFELPQIFFMRVAMGLAIEEKNKEDRAIEFYNLLSSFDYMASTPTLFNAGTLRPQLSSCYLTTVPDDLSGIYHAIHDNAMLSKFAGGLGNDWTPVRALGSYIKGTNGKSQGVVPFLKVVNDTAVAVNQGGKRKGAVCAYLETWHMDIEEFIELRKNTGDDRRRTHDMNTANWIPDLFMKRVFDDGHVDPVLAVRSARPARPDRQDVRRALRVLRSADRIPRQDQTVQDHPGQRSVAQDALDAVRNRPPMVDLQRPVQPAQPAAARRRGPQLEPVHRNHLEHQQGRNRRLQPGLDQPAEPHPRRQAGHRQAQAHGQHRCTHAR